MSNIISSSNQASLGARPILGLGGSTLSRSRTKCEKISNPDAYVLRRIIKITEALYARYGRDTPNVTMAVAVAEDEMGCCHKLISSNEGSYLRPDVRQLALPDPDEIVIDGFHHAEQNIVSFVMSNCWKLKSIGASRAVCKQCQIAIGWYGVTPITLVK